MPAYWLDFIASCADVMENPPVNPFHGGAGRTHAQRQKELLAYKNATRAGVSSLGCPALFQSDYLFVQLAPNSPVQLHRVCHGAIISEATAPEILFTTLEYKHTPQEGVQGFFGTFSPTPNPSYDARNAKKSGGKMLRHKNVDRSCVKVYNVRTFNAKGALCVSYESLKELSSSCEGFQLPSRVPTSHAHTYDSSEDELAPDSSDDEPPPQGGSAANPAASRPQRKRSRPSADDESHSEGSEVPDSPASVISGEDLDEDADDSVSEDAIFAGHAFAESESVEPVLSRANAVGRKILVPASEWQDDPLAANPEFVGWLGHIIRYKHPFFMLRLTEVNFIGNLINC